MSKLRIHFNTGIVWTKPIEVEGQLGDDLLQLIDDYYYEHGDLPVSLYSLEDLSNIYTKDELETHLQELLPINGGEFYIDGISHVEEI